jgi:hypothetical protein
MLHIEANIYEALVAVVVADIVADNNFHHYYCDALN